MDPELLEILRRNSGLTLDREGRFFHQGKPIVHARSVQTLERGLEVREDGEVVVHVGNQWAYVEPEDSVYVVRNVVPERDEEGGLKTLTLVMTGDRREALDPATLVLHPPSDLYCLVGEGRVRARFLRPAFHALEPFLIEDDKGFALAYSDGPVPIVEHS
jgi:hypothetical protein